MKKILILTLFLTLSISIVNANEGIKQNNLTPQNIAAIRMQREQAFEKRLALTEEQKAQAKQIRLNGHERIKPVIEEIKAKIENNNNPLNIFFKNPNLYSWKISLIF